MGSYRRPVQDRLIVTMSQKRFPCSVLQIKRQKSSHCRAKRRPGLHFGEMQACAHVHDVYVHMFGLQYIVFFLFACLQVEITDETIAYATPILQGYTITLIRLHARYQVVQTATASPSCTPVVESIIM